MIWAPAKSGLTVTFIIYSANVVVVSLHQARKSFFYQILEGTKAFINAITGSSLDSVVSLPINLFVKFATSTDWRPFLCCGVLFWVPVATAAHTYLCLVTSYIHTETSKVRFRCSSGGSCKTCLSSTYLCKKVPGSHKIGIVGEMLSWCISASEGW